MRNPGAQYRMSGACGFSYADLLERNARLHGHAPALMGDFGSLSHGALFARSRRLACSLRQLGMQEGDRIALLASNGPRMVELLGAAAMCGAVVILLNTRGSASEIAGIVGDSKARNVFADAALQPLVAGLTDAAGCYALSGEPGGRLQKIPDGDLPAATWPAVGADLPLVGIPTAAVQGRPRIALLSHAALLSQALQLSARWSLASHDRHLCILPLFHMAGLTLALAAQLVGGASALMTRFDAGAAVDAIEAHGASFFASFAPMLEQILDAADARQARLASLRIVSGLEPRSVSERLTRSYPRVEFWNGYGQTEAGGMVTLAPASDHPDSVGRPLAQVALRIAAADGTEVPDGERGEILVRSPGVFSGYLGQPEANAYAARGGWHHTGDLGSMDADGYLSYMGRAPEKTLIKSGGENIYPAEVEQILLAHPAIAQARVIGVPDEKWGEAVRALCVLRPGAQVQEQELIDFVGTRIARFKRPREVLFVSSLD